MRPSTVVRLNGGRAEVITDSLGEEGSRAASDGDTHMSDRSVEVVPATAPIAQSTANVSAVNANRAAWVGMVVLLDYIAAFLAFAAAGAYLVLKAYNDQQSALMSVIEQPAQWSHYIGIHQIPGLPHDYRALRTFTDPFLAETYILVMAALHLLASAGFLALAVALGGFRNWARGIHILIAMFALLILGGYAAIFVLSASARIAQIGLAVMAVAAVVPAAVIAILLVPGVASLFDEMRRHGADSPPRPRVRATFRPRVLISTFLALVVLGGLATVLVVSIPIAIQIRLALAPAE